MRKPRANLLVGSWHLLFQRMAFGNPTQGKTETMKEALSLVNEVNKQIALKFPDIQFAVSGHLNHEIAIPSGVPGLENMSQYNNPRAIGIEEWGDGVTKGIYPEIGRIIPAGFGYEWSDGGAFVNDDRIVRETSHKMFVYAMRLSNLVKVNNFGRGEVIYWTGPDGIRWDRLVERGEDPQLSYQSVPQLPEWKAIVGGVGGAIKEARGVGLSDELVLIEGKPGGDPCYLDVMLDPRLECECIKAINEEAGCAEAPQAYWQNEFCHARSGGVTFAESMNYAIEQGVFKGHIHLNSGGLGQVDFRKLLAGSGTRMSLFPQYVDPDYLPGQGPEEWIADQCQSLKIAADWSRQTGEVAQIEFDARFIRYADWPTRLLNSAIWTLEQYFSA